MTVIGSKKRCMRESDGGSKTLIIRRLKCFHCHRIHHELPDMIVPYKRHCADTVEEILTGTEKETYPCETSTARRLKIWFSLLREYFERSLAAIKYIYKQDKQLQQELSSLIPLCPASLAAGWLKKLVRILVNSGHWLQTRLA